MTTCLSICFFFFPDSFEIAAPSDSYLSAEPGQDVTLTCQLPRTWPVQQVIWEKVQPHQVDILASCNLSQETRYTSKYLRQTRSNCSQGSMKSITTAAATTTTANTTLKILRHDTQNWPLASTRINTNTHTQTHTCAYMYTNMIKELSNKIPSELWWEKSLLNLWPYPLLATNKFSNLTIGMDTWALVSLLILKTPWTSMPWFKLKLCDCS